MIGKKANIVIFIAIPLCSLLEEVVEYKKY